MRKFGFFSSDRSASYLTEVSAPLPSFLNVMLPITYMRLGIVKFLDFVHRLIL